MKTKKRQPSYSGEFRDWAVRLVEEQQKAGLSQWAAIQSISQKLGCTAETLRRWVRRVERDEGKRPGLPRRHDSHQRVSGITGAVHSARFIWLNTNERNVDAVRLYTRAGLSSARERWQGGRQLWLERELMQSIAQ